MRGFRPLLAALASALFLISCVDNHEGEIDPVTRMYDSIAKADSIRLWGPAKEIDFAGATAEEELDQLRVSIEGYIGISDSVTETSERTFVQLRERKYQRFGDFVAVGILRGQRTNSMDSLPFDYTATDFVLRDQKGERIATGTRVKITGIYHRPRKSKYGSIEAQLIEPVADVPTDYSALTLQQVKIDEPRDAYEGMLVKAEGYITFPISMNVDEEAEVELSEGPFRGEGPAAMPIRILISAAAAPNTISEISADYNPENITVRDHKGNTVGQKKVWIYGFCRNGAIHVEQVEIHE